MNTLGGSSVSSEPEVSDLENDLLGGKPESVEPSNVEQQPNDNTNGQQNEPIKNIQKLTGKLAQEIRDASDNMTDKDIKYTLNSIISATNNSLLDDKDKNDIISKLNKTNTDQNQITEPEQMTEDASGLDDNTFYDNIINNKLVGHILDMADLTYEMTNIPEEIAFDFCEAAYIFIHDYNDSNEFINNLKSLLNQNQFKPRPSLQSKNDLEYFGDMIYDAMVKHQTEHTGMSEQDNTIARFTASGGQTVGEGAINERILSILDRAKQNVKNKLNN